MVNYKEGWVYHTSLPNDLEIITTLMINPQTNELVIPPMEYDLEWVKAILKAAVKDVNARYNTKDSATQITVVDNVITFKLKGDLEVSEMLTNEIVSEWKKKGVTLKVVDLDL